jgi:hypothetical protein
MRLILVPTAFVFICSIANAQVRTNINNEVITAKGKFKKNYNGKAPYCIATKKE